MEFIYRTEILRASDVGAPHHRDRWFLLADSECKRQQVTRGFEYAEHTTTNPYREADWLVSHVQGSAMPYVCRRHDGVPNPMDCLKALGNAQVPLQAATAWKLLGGE